MAKPQIGGKHASGRVELVAQVDHPVEHRLGIVAQRVDGDERAALTGETFLLATHAANFDIGTIQPLAELGRTANDAGVTGWIEKPFAFQHRIDLVDSFFVGKSLRAM